MDLKSFKLKNFVLNLNKLMNGNQTLESTQAYSSNKTTWHKCFTTGQSHAAEDCYMYIPLPLENSDKQLPKLDFFPQIVSVLVFPSTSFIKAENTLCEQMIGKLGFLQMHIDNHQKELIHTLPNTHNCQCRTHSPTMNLSKWGGLTIFSRSCLPCLEVRRTSSQQ